MRPDFPTEQQAQIYLAQPDSIRSAPRPPSTLCPSCQYDLVGLTIGSQCPECGQVIAIVYPNTIPPSGYATWSLVCGILAFPGCILFGLGNFFFGILSIAFWFATRKQVRANHRAYASMATANAGLICSIVAMVIGGLFWLLAMI